MSKPSDGVNVALVFPGQGSQRVGMGVALAAESPSARLCFEEASDVLGLDLLRLCGEGPEDRLRLTENAQPAILVVSVAAFRCWQERIGIAPVCAAGHSLGEYSALVAAGSMTLADAARTVRLRGQAMQRAVPVGEGAMAAVIGLDEASVANICQKAGESGTIAIANDNAPGQIVVSGDVAAIEAAKVLAKEAGAKRFLPLDVSAPFHCGLMAPAAEELRLALEAVDPIAPAFPVIANLDAKPYPGDAAAIRDRLVRQVTATVRWQACVRAMAGTAGTFLELGAGKVTLGLVKRIVPEAALANVEAPGDVESATAAMQV